MDGLYDYHDIINFWFRGQELVGRHVAYDSVDNMWWWSLMVVGNGELGRGSWRGGGQEGN